MGIVGGAHPVGNNSARAVPSRVGGNGLAPSGFLVQLRPHPAAWEPPTPSPAPKKKPQVFPPGAKEVSTSTGEAMEQAKKLAHYSTVSIYSAPSTHNAEDSYRC